MEAKELRIGNLIQHNSKVITVLGIAPHCSDSAITTNNEWVYLKNCEAIPLTEEWLLKVGFQRALLPGMYYSPSSDYHIVVFKGFIFRGLGASVVEVKTVHQLQNLYYALVGIELTILQS